MPASWRLIILFKGDYVEAEKLQREALRINRKVLGDKHPIVAAELNNLAKLLWKQVRSFGLAHTLSENVGPLHTLNF